MQKVAICNKKYNVTKYLSQWHASLTGQDGIKNTSVIPLPVNEGKEIIIR